MWPIDIDPVAVTAHECPGIPSAQVAVVIWAVGVIHETSETSVDPAPDLAPVLRRPNLAGEPGVDQVGGQVGLFQDRGAHVPGKPSAMVFAKATSSSVNSIGPSDSSAAINCAPSASFGR